MSHCAPVARKPICLEFTPEAAIGMEMVDATLLRRT